MDFGFTRCPLFTLTTRDEQRIPSVGFGIVLYGLGGALGPNDLPLGLSACSRSQRISTIDYLGGSALCANRFRLGVLWRRRLAYASIYDWTGRVTRGVLVCTNLIRIGRCCYLN